MPGIIPGVPKSKGNKGFYLDVVEKEELPKVLWDFGKEFPNFGRWDGIPKRATGFLGMFKAGFAWNKGMGGDLGHSQGGLEFHGIPFFQGFPGGWKILGKGWKILGKEGGNVGEKWVGSPGKEGGNSLEKRVENPEK